MSSTESVLATRALSACRGSSVADAAGVAALTWADEDTPRVFRGLGGYLGGRNRGRLPFLEVSVGGSDIGQTSNDGGEGMTTIHLRAHCGGADLGTAEDLTAGMLSAAIAAIRSETTDNLAAVGSDQIDALEPGPWGCQRDARVMVVQSWARDDYEVA